MDIRKMDYIGNLMLLLPPQKLNPILTDICEIIFDISVAFSTATDNVSPTQTNVVTEQVVILTQNASNLRISPSF